ncbi:hypothetical protein D3C84_393100 [compost metagenome]
MGVLRGSAAQLIEAEQQRRAEHQRTQRWAVEQAATAETQFTEEGQRRPQLQQQGKGPGQWSMLTQSEPVDPRPLHRPGRRGPARLQRQWNRQAGENHPQRQAGFRQQQGTATAEKTRQPHVDEAQHQGTEGSGELQVLNQRKLQAEAHQRRAEQHRAVDIIALARRPVQQRLTAVILGSVAQRLQFTPGKQQANGQVHQEKQDQERLGAPQQFRRVGTQAPGETDAEGAGKADQVQQPPGLEPGNGQDAGIEQGEIAEQRDMIAGTRGGQDRRGKAAQRGHAGQGQGVLRNGQNRREQRHNHQQPQGRRRVEQRVQAHGGEHRQVQHRDPGTLQHQRVLGVASSQPPAQAKQGQRSGGNTGVTQFNRHHHAFGGVAQQERQAEEQQHHADPQHGIAAEQPIARSRDGALDQIRPTGFGGGLRLSGLCRPWIDRLRSDRGLYRGHFGWQLPDQLLHRRHRFRNGRLLNDDFG